MLSKEEIIETLAPLNSWGKKQDSGIKRGLYLDALKKYTSGKGMITAIIGVRRAGKTFLAKQALEAAAGQSLENTLYVLLEDPKFGPYLGTDLLDNIYGAYREIVSKKEEAYLVLDEIQNVPNWEKWVRLLTEKKENVKIIITGSSSKLLYSKLATALTGRIFTCEVFPLSFKEFLLFCGHEINKKHQLLGKKPLWEKLFREYLTYGGFPQVVLEKDESLKLQYLKEVFEGIIYRDVVARHKGKDVSIIKLVAELALNSFSSLSSANRTRNAAAVLVQRKISPNLILQILSYLEEAFLIFQVPIFSYKVKERKLYPKKYYCIDTGIINAATVNFSSNIGRVYENIAAIYLLKKYGKEREIKALLSAAKELNCATLVIATKDIDKTITKGKYSIVFIPLWKLLLQELI